MGDNHQDWTQPWMSQQGIRNEPFLGTFPMFIGNYSKEWQFFSFTQGALLCEWNMSQYYDLCFTNSPNRHKIWCGFYFQLTWCLRRLWRAVCHLPAPIYLLLGILHTRLLALNFYFNLALIKKNTKIVLKSNTLGMGMLQSYRSYNTSELCKWVEMSKCSLRTVCMCKPSCFNSDIHGSFLSNCKWTAKTENFI